MMIATGSREQTAPVGHAVCFYADLQELTDLTTAHLRTGLASGGIGIVVATDTHRQRFEAQLVAEGLEVPAAPGDGSLVMLDAAEALETFMVDGSPDPARFDATIGQLIRQAASTGRAVCVYGEMVALLWDAGWVPAAIELEQLWNDLGEEAAFSLLCGYQRDAVAGVEHARALEHVCQLHAAVHGTPLGGSVADGHVVRTFDCDPEQPRAARRLTRETMSAWGRTGVADDAALIVSELATNAVRHAVSSFTLTLTDLGHAVRVEVQDRSSARAAPREPDELGGRGLVLVEQLAARWGTDTIAGGKIVWAELA